MEIHLFISLLALQLVLLFALVIVEITAVVYPWLLRKPKAFDYFGISLLLRFGVRLSTMCIYGLHMYRATSQERLGYNVQAQYLITYGLGHAANFAGVAHSGLERPTIEEPVRKILFISFAVAVVLLSLLATLFESQRWIAFSLAGLMTLQGLVSFTWLFWEFHDMENVPLLVLLLLLASPALISLIPMWIWVTLNEVSLRSDLCQLISLLFCMHLIGVGGRLKAVLRIESGQASALATSQSAAHLQRANSPKTHISSLEHRQEDRESLQGHLTGPLNPTLQLSATELEASAEEVREEV